MNEAKEHKSHLHGDPNGNYAIITDLTASKKLITKKIDGMLTTEEVELASNDESLLKQQLNKRLLPDFNLNREPKVDSYQNGGPYTGSDLAVPKFDDELEIQSPTQPPPWGISGQLPSVGSSDLQPTKKYPQMKPYMDPLQQSSGGFNGMIVDKNHPLFGQNAGAGAGLGPGRGEAPFGARYDDPFLRDESVGLGLPRGSLGGGPGGRFGGSGSSGPAGGNPFGGLI